MKKISLIVILLFSLSIYSQTLKVDYKRITLTQYISKEGSKEFVDKVRKKQKAGDHYILYYKNGNSYFTKTKYITIMHDNAPKLVKGKEVLLTEVHNDFPVKFYRNKDDDFFYIFSKVNGSKGYKKDQLKLDNIEFLDSIETIENYTCKLVEFTLSGQNYKAWYTEDIPISIGPFAFAHFPGVILKIEAPQYIIFATKISNDFPSERLEKLDDNLPVFKE